MLCKTKGIVLRLTPYGEKSAIVNILTEQLGLKSYIIKSLRSKAAKNKIGIYQPLNLLNMVVYQRDNAKILHIKEAHCSYIYHSLSRNLKKSSIVLFLNEVLNRVTTEQGQVSELYDFLQVSFITLDSLKENEENFHLIFLIKLIRLLGFGIGHVHEMESYHTLSSHEQTQMSQLLIADYTTAMHMNNTERRHILNALLRFYASHIHTMGSLKSVRVLKEVFD